MFLKIFLNIVLLLNVISFTSVKASDVCSESFTFRDIYQKPAFMAALDWVQALEDERDKADIVGNFDAFKKTTDEISATIAGKYGLAQRSATPEEQLVIIHSITRTRHRFIGQRNMVYDRYLGYDRTATSALLQTDLRFTNHMAAVLAIDIMVRKALNEDEFHEQWDQWTETKIAPEEAVPAVISHAQTYEKKEVFEALKQPLQDFLQQRQDTISLANDVFNVFAPKMTLTRFYHEVIPSGGAYKGWAVHKTGDLAYLATLTEEEKRRLPNLESEIRTSLTQLLMESNYASDVFSSSERAVVLTDETRDQLGLKEDEMVVEYIYDPCLRERGYSVDGTGPKSFYLSRPVKPQLSKVLKRQYGVVPSTTLLESYKLAIMSIKDPTIIENAIKRGIAWALAHYGYLLENDLQGIKKDLLKAVQFTQEAANLGNKLAESNLPFFLNSCSVHLFHGQGLTRDILKAIEMMREAARLGDKDAKGNLPRALNDFAGMLLDGEDGMQKDVFRAIAFYREAAELGNESAKRNLPIALNDYAIMLFNGENGITRDIPQAIEICREAIELRNEEAKRKLPLMILEYSVKLFYGRDGVVKDIFKSIEMMRKAAELGNDEAKRNLSKYSLMLFDGKKGITRDMPHALEIMREAANFGNDEAKKNLPVFLYDYAVMLLYGQEGIQADFHKATEIMGEAAGLGFDKATYMLSAMRLSRTIVAACRK